MGSSKCWHCGIPLQSSTKWVAIAETAIGVFFSVVFGMYVKEAFEHGSSYWNSRDNSYDSTTYKHLRFLSRELGVTILVLHVLQITFGVVLFFGAMNKSRTICQVWLAFALVTAVLLNYLILLRIYEMFIVYEYNRELKEEEVTYYPGHHQEVQQAKPEIPPPTTQASAPQQPPPVYPQQQQQTPPFGNSIPNDGQGHYGFPPPPPPGSGMSPPHPPLNVSVISGESDGGIYGVYSQVYNNHHHQYPQPQYHASGPVVATPVVTGQQQQQSYGMIGNGSGAQYSPQLPYNPATRVQVPSALLPQQPQQHSPRYDPIVLRDVGPTAPTTTGYGQNSNNNNNINHSNSFNGGGYNPGFNNSGMYPFINKKDVQGNGLSNTVGRY